MSDFNEAELAKRVYGLAKFLAADPKMVPKINPGDEFWRLHKSPSVERAGYRFHEIAFEAVEQDDPGRLGGFIYTELAEKMVERQVPAAEDMSDADISVWRDICKSLCRVYYTVGQDGLMRFFGRHVDEIEWEMKKRKEAEATAEAWAGREAGSREEWLQNPAGMLRACYRKLGPY